MRLKNLHFVFLVCSNHSLIVLPLSAGVEVELIVNCVNQLPWSLSKRMSSDTNTTALKISLRARTYQLCWSGENSGDNFFFSSRDQKWKPIVDILRYLRQGSEYDPNYKEKETSSGSEKSSKKEKSTWSGLYTKMCVLFPYLWPKGKLGLQGMIVTRVPKKI